MQVYYNEFLAQNLHPIYTQSNQARFGNIPSVQASADAASNERASLLRNEAYVRTFDVDSNNVLSSAERLALENSLSDALIAPRQTVGAAVADGYWTTLISYTETPDLLQQILSVYLNL
jgi:hypothetical protein